MLIIVKARIAKCAPYAWLDGENVGWDNDYSINDFNQTAAKVIGYKGKFTHDLTKPEGRKNRRTDKTLQKRFGWQPKVDLEEGIRRAYDFYLQSDC